MPLFLRGAADPSRGWQARLRSSAALFLLLVVQGLTYSRGGYVALLAALVVFFVLVPWRWRALAILGAVGLCSLWTLSFAFAREDLTTNALPLSRRVDDGVLLLLVFLGLLAVALGAVRGVIELEQRRTWTEAQARRARAAASSPRSCSSRSCWRTSSAATSPSTSSPRRSRIRSPTRPASARPTRATAGCGGRRRWALVDQPLGGYGAGSFPVTHLQYRKDRLRSATPLGAAAVPRRDGIDRLCARCRRAAGADRRCLVAGGGAGAWEAAVAAVPVAYLVHWLYDWDWDFPAVTLAMLLFCGVIVARPATRVLRRAPRRAGDGRGIGLVAAVALLSGAALSAGCPRSQRRSPPTR